MFPEASARLLFADGYRHVHERYIDAIPVERIAQAAFAGLTHLSPDLQIRRTADQVQPFVADRTMRAYLLPAPGDAARWAKLTAGILQPAWATSATLRPHPPEPIYPGP